jgi:hypothetical protein
MRMLVLGAALAAAVAIPATAASAQRYGYGNGYGYGYGNRGNGVQRELRECRRELRRADSRWEYQRELRECRRELAEARRDQYRDGRYRRGYRNDYRGYRNW